MGAPRIERKSATSGRQSSTPLEMIDVAVSAAPAEPGCTPDADIMRYPVAAPIAAPPGTVLATAFDVSCDVAATNHVSFGSAMRESAHAHM
jgi:hypothetical protein